MDFYATQPSRLFFPYQKDVPISQFRDLALSLFFVILFDFKVVRIPGADIAKHILAGTQR